MKRKSTANIQVTGRAVAYIQPVNKKGKPGKAQPVVITTVRAGGAPPTKKKRRKRK